MKRPLGFTLVEVMVAMAVVAVALPALLLTMDQQIDNTGYLRDKNLAQMVASNKLAETRLIVAATRELSKSKSDGMMELAERDWYWRSEIQTTLVPNYFKVVIAVASEEGPKAAPLYTLVGYMMGDLRTDPGGSTGGGNPGNGGSNGGANGGSSGGNGGTNGGSPSTDVSEQLREALEQRN